MDTDLIVRLRRMVAEPTDVNYTDEELWELIEAQSVTDVDGNEPDEDDWTPTYNLNKVAGDIWAEKASRYAEEFDFNTDGGSFSRSQKYENALRQSQYYYSRSKASVLRLRQEPITRGLNALGYEDTDYKDWDRS